MSTESGENGDLANKLRLLLDEGYEISRMPLTKFLNREGKVELLSQLRENQVMIVMTSAKLLLEIERRVRALEERSFR